MEPANAQLGNRLLLQADVNAYITNAALLINIVSSPTYGSYTW